MVVVKKMVAHTGCTSVWCTCCQQDLESCRLRLDPEMDRHRYERKISFAGVLDENEDSKDSLHSSSHTLKSEAGFEEKKGLLAQQSFCILGACEVALDFMFSFA